MSAAQAVDWVSAAAGMQFPKGMLVDGRQVGADSGEVFTVIGPRDGRAIASLPEASAAELDQAVAAQTAAFAIFMNSGQVCAAGSRLLVQNSVLDQVLQGVTGTASIFAPADPLSATTLMGPLAKREQFDRVLGYIEAGRQAGARVACGGAATRQETGGFYIQPTIFHGVSNDMRIAREEIFGPVLSVIGFETEEEAVRIANDSEYGLAAGLWTANLARAHRVSSALRCGTVSVNVYGTDAPELTVPFGGYKGSGFGRDKSLHAIDKYVQLKTVWMATT
jgi:acyl-CoA reductase-like NAD-dependent aldehyde dehydrogenase